MDPSVLNSVPSIRDQSAKTLGPPSVALEEPRGAVLEEVECLVQVLSLIHI